jgi:hypothetical protein
VKALAMKKPIARFIQRNSNGDHEVVFYQVGCDFREQSAECVCVECGAGIPLCKGNLCYIDPEDRLRIRTAVNLAKVRRYCCPTCQQSATKRNKTKSREAKPRIIESAETF